jgi:hypothetical protein
MRFNHVIVAEGHDPDCEYAKAQQRLEEDKILQGIPAEQILAGDAQPFDPSVHPVLPHEVTKPRKDWMEFAQSKKPTNPKDAVGVLKYAMSYVSAPVLAEIAVGMTEGGHKYGRHNYRVIGVRASIYYDATMRHLMQWWEGEDIDPDSGLSHITKAITSLVVLRDAMIQEMFTDDRPPKSKAWSEDMNKRTKALDAKYPTKVPSYTELKS